MGRAMVGVDHTRGRSRRHRRPWVTMVALRTPRLTELGYDEELVALRLLTDRRDALSRRRVQTVNRLHRLLTELITGGAKRDLVGAAGQAAAGHGQAQIPGGEDDPPDGRRRDRRPGCGRRQAEGDQEGAPGRRAGPWVAT
jgi:hypothetical protein